MTDQQTAWAEKALEQAAGKLRKVSARSGEKIPYTTVNGRHDDKSGDEIGWWTNGFWGGMMWQMYTLTGEDRYRQIAVENEKKLDRCLMHYDQLDHDNGFKWLPTAVAHYRVTGNPESRNRGLLAAGNLAGRYNCAGQFIRAWNDWSQSDVDRSGWAIIDCMMNLPLLYWAARETGDPRFAQIAVRHACTAQSCFIRGDGSANHIVVFDPVSGEMVRSHGGQGCGEGSSWTRGQSWALYGFVLSYIHTQEASFLETAERVANYFLANIPESGRIPVDFRQPPEVSLEDSTAAAIATCGLIELAKLKEGRQRGVYLHAVLKLLQALQANSLNTDEEEDNLLTKCTAAYHDEAHEFSIIYGDYFYLEALMKLNGKDLFIW